MGRAGVKSSADNSLSYCWLEGESLIGLIRPINKQLGEHTDIAGQDFSCLTDLRHLQSPYHNKPSQYFGFD